MSIKKNEEELTIIKSTLDDLILDLVDRIESVSHRSGVDQERVAVLDAEMDRLKREITELRNPVAPQTSFNQVLVPYAQIARIVEVVIQSGDEKIKAIKAIRELTHMGLKEAKDVVDSLWPVLNTLTRFPRED
jgi:ribosomal protein L7/L12